MRLLHACPPSCKRLRIDAESSRTAERRCRALELVNEMVEGGMSRLDTLKVIGLARTTRPRSVSRRWTDADDQAVLRLREEHPHMGKARLRTMLARNGLALPVSAVGRIFSKAIADERIKPAFFCERCLKPKSPASWSRSTT